MQTFEVKTGWLVRLVSPFGENFGVVGTRGDRDQRLQPTHVTAVRNMRRRMRNRAVLGWAREIHRWWLPRAEILRTVGLTCIPGLVKDMRRSLHADHQHHHSYGETQCNRCYG